MFSILTFHISLNTKLILRVPGKAKSPELLFFIKYFKSY